LLKKGRIVRGYLGIMSRAAQPGEQTAPTEGVVVEDVVPNSPAAQAQLQKGDIIRKFNGREINNFAALRTLVAQAELNKPVELEIVRNGNAMKVTTEIKEQPVDYESAQRLPSRRQPQRPAPPNQPGGVGGGLNSIRVTDLTPDLVRQLDLPNNVHGVVVTDVDPDSGMAELQKGDVIEEINQQPIASISDYNRIVASLDRSQAQVLSVCRHRMRSFLVIRPQ
jgi:serine protease Do